MLDTLGTINIVLSTEYIETKLIQIVGSSQYYWLEMRNRNYNNAKIESKQTNIKLIQPLQENNFEFELKYENCWKL